MVPLVYEQLRSAAQRELAAERQGHTLSATALVHEAYLRLVGQRQVPWAGRGHFYAAAAEAMRRVLIDHARGRRRLRRGGGDAARPDAAALASISELFASDCGEEFLMLDSALRRLEVEDPEAAQVVRLRFFAGLSGDETALALGKSPSTVDRDWAWARAWLFRQLRPEAR